MYRLLWPLVRLLPPELAHRLGLFALQLPLGYARRPADDPFEWHGLRFRNRVGIAAGFDKNAVALPGIERLGVGFVEVGTVLVEPWPGNPAPRLRRLAPLEAVWNRLGFPSDGLAGVRQRLARFPRSRRRGLVVGCNIGPHPGHLKSVADPAGFTDLARGELLRLIDGLHEHTDFFVVNFSSPNTPGLRGILMDPRLARDLARPLKQRLRQLDRQEDRPFQTALLIKLPPEDADRNPWSADSLAAVVRPLLEADGCDGFVAVNTSTRLSAQLLNSDAGGISGAPLRDVALESLRLLRTLTDPGRLLVGCGGVTRPDDAVALARAGAQLVELYTGMIFHGPGLPARCADAVRTAR
jgi:dihydroorotate dehydrogenase